VGGREALCSALDVARALVWGKGLGKVLQRQLRHLRVTCRSPYIGGIFGCLFRASNHPGWYNTGVGSDAPGSLYENGSLIDLHAARC